MSKQKLIKVRTFPGAIISDIKFFVIPHLRKKPDKIVLHVGTNNAPHATPKEIFNAIKDLKSFIRKCAPESKKIISTPVLPVDKANVNNINKKYIKSSIIYEGIGKVSILLFFFYEEILNAKEA